MHNSKPRLLVLLIIVLTVALGGCNLQSLSSTVATQTITPTTSGTQTGRGSAMDLLHRSLQAMKSVQSYHSVVTDTTDTGKNALSARLDEDFVAPDKLRIVGDIPAIGLSEAGRQEILMIGEDIYEKRPGATYYLVRKGANPDKRFDRTHEFLKVIPILDTATIVGDEAVNGLATTHVNYTYNMKKTGGLVPGEASGDVWIEKSTVFVRKLSNASDPSVSETLSKYNELVSPPIERPLSATPAPNLFATAQPTP